MKKIIIIGGGLSGLLIANLLLKKEIEIYLLEKQDLNINDHQSYYKLKKKNLHAHVFPSIFCYYLKRYLPNIYNEIQSKNANKKIVFEKFFINSLDLSKVELQKTLFNNIFPKVIYHRKVNFINLIKQNNKISQIKFECNNVNQTIDNVDTIFDCSGINSYFKKYLEENDNLNSINIEKKRNILTFFFNITGDKSINRLNKLILNKNITVYEKNYNLSIIKNKTGFSASFVSSEKKYLEREFVRKILINYLRKNDISDVIFEKNLKWSHLESSFIKHKSLEKSINNLIPIGESFMKTNPELGQGSTLSLLQSVYIFNKFSKDFNFDEYLNLFSKIFKILEIKPSKSFKFGKRNYLKKLIPYYMELRHLYSFYRERKKYKLVLDKIN